MAGSANSNVPLTSIHGSRVGIGPSGRLLVNPRNRGFRAAGIAYVAEAPSTAVSNTTTETLFDNYITIPANTLAKGSLIQIRYQGIMTATNGSDTFNHKLYLGGLSGTALLSGTATDGVDNMTYWGDYWLTVRTVGTSGTVVGNGFFKKAPAAEATQTIVDDILASTALDTTIDQVVGVSMTQSAASASNSARLDFLSVVVY